MAIYEPDISFFKMQLNSILAQTHRVSEIIVSDDKSSSGVFCEVEEFVNSLGIGIKLTQNSVRLGYGDNFLKCLKSAAGDVVFFCDQDDYWFPTKVERILNYFASRPSINLLIHDLIRTRKDLSITEFSMINSFRQRGACLSTYVYGAASAIHRRMVPLALAKPEGLAHDDWIHSLGVLLNTRAIIEEPLGYYRRHDDAFTEQQHQDNANNLKKNTFYKRSRAERALLALHLLEANYAQAQYLEDAIKNNASKTFAHDQVLNALAIQARATSFVVARMNIYRSSNIKCMILALARALLLAVKARGTSIHHCIEVFKDLILSAALCNSQPGPPFVD